MNAMKLLCQAIRAVTVELCGVLLVVSVLLGFTAMGLHSASGQEPLLGQEVAERWESLSRPASMNTRNQTAPGNRVAEILSSFGDVSPTVMAVSGSPIR